MAYVLTSFVQIYEQDHYHLMLDIKPQIEPLLEKARFLRDLFIETSYSIALLGKVNLESQMRDVVHKAEDLIESYIRDQVLSVSQYGTSHLELADVMEEFDSVKEKMLKIVGLGKVYANPLLHSLKITSSAKLDPSFRKHVPSSRDSLVGLERECEDAIGRLLQGSLKLRTISIVGMAGIGKTTFAQTVYNRSVIVSAFDTRVWVTISQEYNVQTTLLALLDSLGKLTDEMRMEQYDTLGKHVHNILKGRKYLIVLDDIWDLEAWYKIIRFFPDDGRRSRILLTTRSREVGERAGRTKHFFDIRFMSHRESLILFLSEVFGKRFCPVELKFIGQRIAEICKGHPLAIKLVAGLLATSEKTLKFWELVEKNLLVLEKSFENHILYVQLIIAMSYNHLPYYLKPCFLYMGAFPEDYEISASKIIKMWIAEGLVEPIAGNSLEDTAEVYLRALIDKNLLIICQQEPNGKIKTFKIHDLLRDFCQKEAVEKEFLWYKYLNGANVQRNEKFMRRVSVSPLSQPSQEMELMSFVRSFMCIGRPPLRLARMFAGLSLLRVLDVFELEFYQFPTEILQLVLLRYLAFSCHSYLPASISRLQNLQTLIIRRLPSFRAFSLPSELWELAQLRHVKSKETCTCYFRTNENNYFIQENLQTLSNVQMVGLTNELLGKFPNIRKLGLFGNITMDNVIDLACLHKLEKLKCSSDWSLAAHNFLSFLTIPVSLKKLTLRFCKIPLGFMATIGSLPNLEQLKLQKSDFLGSLEPEWVPTEGEFASLILLNMEDLNLVHWKANSTHFPRLEHLIIRRCPIAHISTDIGNIPTIQLIKVDKFSPSLMDSVMQLQREQESRENEILEVHIRST